MNQDFFQSFRVSIKSFLQNTYDPRDSGKNYLVPLYQRRFVWNASLVQKLITDIKEIAMIRQFEYTAPYFIGGVVLCRELTSEEKPFKSLEIIDGQQRLTTISLIIACIYHELKYNKSRQFGEKINWVNKQIKTIEELLFSIREIPGSFDIEEVLTIERQDEIRPIYKDILLSFKYGTYQDLFYNTNTEEKYPDVSHIYRKKILLASEVVYNDISSFDDSMLLDFTSQLLDFTFLVITKTSDINTGFLVFEKLNDSGASLEPEDLLKSFLFANEPTRKFNTLSDKWKILLNLIEEINPTKTKMLPREFLDHFLTIKGLEQGDMDKGRIFKIFKDYYTKNNISANSLIEELIDIAKKYKELKHHIVIKKYFNALNFKLGYLILLGYYKFLGNEKFEQKKQEIFLLTLRLGFSYILSENARNVRNVINKVCSELNNKNDQIEEINIKIKSLKAKFTNYLSSNNLFQKKKIVKIVLEIIAYHSIEKMTYDNYRIELLTNEKYNKKCNLDDEEIYALYAYKIGNVFLIENNCKVSDVPKDLCLEKRIQLFSQYKTTLSKYNFNNWDKDSIENNSEKLAKNAADLIIDNKIDVNMINL